MADEVVIAMFSRLVNEYATTRTEFTALMATEAEQAFGASTQVKIDDVMSLLKYAPSSLTLWRIPELKGYHGFACTTADKLKPGVWWTADGLKVATPGKVAAGSRPRLRKYLARVRHFRGSAQFGEAWISGEAGGAPLIQIRSIDELDLAEEGVPPASVVAAAAPPPTAGAPTAAGGGLALDEVEQLTGTDIDGDGDVGVADSEERPRRKRVWNGKSWVMDWEYKTQIVWDDTNWEYTDDVIVKQSPP